THQATPPETTHTRPPQHPAHEKTSKPPGTQNSAASAKSSWAIQSRAPTLRRSTAICSADVAASRSITLPPPLRRPKTPSYTSPSFPTQSPLRSRPTTTLLRLSPTPPHHPPTKTNKGDVLHQCPSSQPERYPGQRRPHLCPPPSSHFLGHQSGQHQRRRLHHGRKKSKTHQ